MYKHIEKNIKTHVEPWVDWEPAPRDQHELSETGLEPQLGTMKETTGAGHNGETTTCKDNVSGICDLKRSWVYMYGPGVAEYIHLIVYSNYF